MILITAPRSEAETILRHFFPVINIYKATRINNVAHMDRLSEEYLSALVINCLVTELEKLFQKQLVNTVREKIKFQFSDAQAVVLYKSFMAMPLDAEKVYYNIIRNRWIEVFNQQLYKTAFYNIAAFRDGSLKGTFM